jgi:hypothetical protein
MPNWNDFTTAVISGVKADAAGAFTDYVGQIQTMANEFLTQAKADLETWSVQLAKGEITKDDFAENVQGDADLVKMAALTEAGIALADAQRLRDALINTVIDASVKFLI